MFHYITLAKLSEPLLPATVQISLVDVGPFALLVSLVNLPYYSQCSSHADHNQASVGAALQAGAINVAMMIAGRFLAGLACGMILSVVPVYIAEVSPPKDRGFIVGLQGMMISIGFMVANWIGYAGDFAEGDTQWRVPLAMQIPGAVLLSIGCIFIPYSPRWLIEKERYEEAKSGKRNTPPSSFTELLLCLIRLRCSNPSTSRR